MTRDEARTGRYRRIVDAARGAFREASFDNVTIEEIARRAGVGPATIYRYFRTKDNIFSIVYGDLLDEVISAIERSDAAARGAGPGNLTQQEWSVERVLSVYRTRSEFYSLEPGNGARYLRAGFEASVASWNRNMEQGDRIITLVHDIINCSKPRLELSSQTAYLVAQNCHAAFMHEVDRESARGLDATTHWVRLEPRLRSQLEPAILGRNFG